MRKELKPFHFWCQKVLPLVYDDSLSYYEVLCKLKDKINEVILSFEDVQEEINEYINSPEFEAWLKLYIDSRKVEISSVAVIGDSNAEGYGWWGGNILNKNTTNDGYCAVLRELYPDSVIDNYASSGAYLRGSTGNVAKEQCDALIRSGKTYQYIFIQVGFNDLPSVLNSSDNIVGYCPTQKSVAMQMTDYTTCVRALCTIINRLRAYSPSSKIIYIVREYQSGGVSYLYPMYCAMFKQIFDTCYLMNVPVLNLEANFINATQNSNYYFDSIHWGEGAYRYYVTPRIIQFINNPVTSGLMGEDYLILCCSLDDVFKGANGKPYLVNTALENAINNILNDSAYFTFTGAILYSINPGTVSYGEVSCLAPYVTARIKRGLHDQAVVISKYGDNYEYYIDHTTLNPTILNDMSYSGAEASEDNTNGYAVIPPYQDVIHEAHNDIHGRLSRLITGAKCGEILTTYSPASNTRLDYYRGGMLGNDGEISLADTKIWNGVYYVPQPNISNIVLGLSDVQAGGYGYTIIVNRQIPGNGVYGVLFAISVTGVYYMLNYSGTWTKI